MKYKNLFYFRLINAIGGIETFLWNIAQKYGPTHDITIMYGEGDPAQLSRLRKYVRVIQWKPGTEVECEKLFCNFNLEIVDWCKADEYCQIAHGDYKAMKLAPNLHPKVATYYGVSRQVCETYEEVTGHPTQLVYEPVIVEKPKKILHLITASRLSREKGSRRMQQLMEAMDRAGIEYEWKIFTDIHPGATGINPDNPRVVWKKPTLSVIDWVADADYLVQLSDNEGFCLSVLESLTVGTPVIVTDCPVFRELGVKDGVNGFILPFEMNDIPLDRIMKGVKKFTFTPPEDRWEDALLPGPSTYLEELNTMVTLRCTQVFTDMEIGRNRSVGEVFTVSKPRAEQIIARRYAVMEEE